MPTTPFIVLSLPRSRSAWLSTYLSYGSARCGHDIAVECPTIDAFTGSFSPGGLVGSCETGAAMAWRVLQARMPGVRFIVVRRPVERVLASLLRMGLAVSPEELESREAQLELVSAQPDTRTLDFDDLSSPQTCQALFEYCLEREWDAAWWYHLARMNIQIDMKAHVARLMHNADQIAGLKAAVLAEQSTMGASQCLH